MTSGIYGIHEIFEHFLHILTIYKLLAQTQKREKKIASAYPIHFIRTTNSFFVNGLTSIAVRIQNSSGFISVSTHLRESNDVEYKSGLMRNILIMSILNLNFSAKKKKKGAQSRRYVKD